MAARIYAMVPTFERLDNFCGAFADVYSDEFAGAYPDTAADEFEQRAWREEWIADRRVVAVSLTYRTPEQQRKRFLSATEIGLSLPDGNPSAVVDMYPYVNGRLARYALHRVAGLVAVNDVLLPEDEVRPLCEEDREAIYGSVDANGVGRADVMARALTEVGQERLITDLSALLAMDGYVQLPQPDEAAYY